MTVESINIQVERLRTGGISLSAAEEHIYCQSVDVLAEKFEKGAVVPAGYKRCGRCEEVKKFYLFNKNSASKTNTSGSCKACQAGNAKKSYQQTKKKRNYKKYYQENKSAKQEQARKYYQANKDKINAKHKEYLGTKKGKQVMQKAHAKRRKSIADNPGIPFTRALVIERDGKFQNQEHPICYMCNKPITDISGEGLHIDHVIPIVEGGLNCFTNVASTHSNCNLTREKDARMLQVEQVESVKKLAERFIEKHPEHFDA